jgi:hypothetical protein
MTDHSPDDARLRATEAQMRHALGLQGDVSPQSSNSGSHPPQRRHFVRDGEVPVTVVNRDHRPGGAPGSNQLDAARQAIRSQAAARERAERLLEEAQAAIRDLQTKLAHERLAKDDAARRAESERQANQQALQTVQDELATERAARQQAQQDQQERADAIAGRWEADERLREAIPIQEAQGAPKLAPKNAPGRKAVRTGAASRPQPSADVTTDADGEACAAATNSTWALPEAVSPDATATAKPRRRGRPPKISQPESDIVEWWKPGWRERLR